MVLAPPRAEAVSPNDNEPVVVTCGGPLTTVEGFEAIRTVTVRSAHVNADWPADFEGDGPRGASDHDPMVAVYCRHTTPRPCR